MAVRVDQTEPGRYYRRTRGATPGGYFMRPNPKLATYIKRLRRKGSKMLTRDDWMLQLHRRHPDHILMLRYNRGTDPMTGERYEVRTYTLLAPDMPLRHVQQRPGYKRTKDKK